MLLLVAFLKASQSQPVPPKAGTAVEAFVSRDSGYEYETV
jgi:hypothetical protein